MMSPENTPAFLAVAGAEPHLLLMLPFAALLLSLAVMPFIAADWWRRHYAKISVGLAAVTVCYYVFGLGKGERVLHAGREYASFIVLIGSLFVVGGGIRIEVRGEAKPWMNCAFLLFGAVLASVIGTTGASMLLIRPWIRMNRYRITTFHVVFFIVLVSNIGGCLTAIGDPPLFLGYLKGVPFWWTLRACWPAWVFAAGAFLCAFYIMDQGNFLRAPLTVRKKETEQQSCRVRGKQNIAWLAMILGAVFVQQPVMVREAMMVGAAAASYYSTPSTIHEANEFSLEPIREVAWIFAGIFATMIPALDYIQGHASELAITSAGNIYWLAGGLSAFLDNAPTYLTFLAAAMGEHHLSLDDPAQVRQFAGEHQLELLAISLGAVFFGAATYIGNGPNFMVKKICEHANVKTAGFGTYVLLFGIPIILPVLTLVWLLFISQWRIR
jgi:Na+/H+ antiporter NhaD/arsenite permease-like protein